MEALACIDFFDLDDTTLAPTHSVDGMHAKPAITNEPRYYQLSHWPPPANAHAGTLRVRTVHFFCNTLNPTRLVPGARARVTILGQHCDRLVTVAELAAFPYTARLVARTCTQTCRCNAWKVADWVMPNTRRSRYLIEVK